MEEWLRKHWFPVLASLVIIVIGLAIWVEIFRLEEFWLAERIFAFLDDWAIILSASITLLLAIAAFTAIRQTRIMRAQDREADFKRRCLDDIRNWALKAIPHFSEDLSIQSIQPIELKRNALASIWAEIASVVRAGSGFNNDFQLAVKEATRNLEEYFNLLNRVIMQWSETTEKGSLPKLTDDTRRSLVKLLQSVADLKVKLQL